ncbi:MAG: efflux RND transporter permease subunit [Bacteroidales bacterium]|nr:efflux RND transporter permease subunit [Bacteroidales bacterium]
MLNKIIRFALNNRLVILAVAILLLGIGSYTAFNMEVDVFPDLNAPRVAVMTEAKGMAPEEVERLVTFPIETAVNGATNVRRVRSSSTTGFSIVWVEFDWGTDVYRARQIVSEKLSLVSEELPDYIGKPVMGPQSSILGEVMIIGLTSDTTSLMDLRTYADWTIRPQLLATGGVAQVAVLGGDVKEYQILLQPELMKHYNVTLDGVMAAINGMNTNSSGGTLYEYGNEYLIRGEVSTTNIEELGKNPIIAEGGNVVLLEQIAKITIGGERPQTGLASNRGKAAVLLTVTKQPNTGTIALTDQILERLEKIKKTLPADIKIDTEIFRQSYFIQNSIDNIQKALIEGGIFVVIILFIFLMNGRTTIISLITIPLSLLITILVMKAMGMTINTMSIGGMAIAIGSLVDDAIVDVENVYKRLRENRLKSVEERKSVISVIYEASKEVRLPILNSTFIIVASFVPLFFLSGMEGRMLEPLGIAFIVSLFASTCVALTLTPVLCSYLLGKDSGDKESKEPIIAAAIKKVYMRALDYVLIHKKAVLSVTAVLFIGALALFFTFGRNFLPPFNEGSFTINVSTLPGISLEESDKIGRDAEELLLTIPEIKTVARKTGRAELDEHALGVNMSEIEAPFELKDRSKEEVMAEIREKIKLLPGVNLEIGQPISHRIDAMLSGTQSSIAIKLFGSDLTTMFTLGNEIKQAIAGVEGIGDLNVEQQIERPQLVIKPKREMLAKYGISLSQFADYVNTLLAGESVSQVYEGNRSFNLIVKVDNQERATMEDIKGIFVDGANGVKVPFEQIATIETADGPNTINRENVERKIVISANASGRDVGSVVKDIQDIVEAEITLPEDYRIEYGGQFESERAASRILLISSIFSILVIFMLLFNQFRNFSQAGLVLLNLPLALIGGVFAIWFTDKVISIPAIIGFISLFGIATRNGMLLIERFNELQSQGISLIQSVKMGCADRLAPILMTALTSALGLLPLALGGELPGNEIQSPMAKVLLGGLLSSTLLNGFVVPISYIIVSKRGKKVERYEISE